MGESYRVVRYFTCQANKLLLFFWSKAGIDVKTVIQLVFILLAIPLTSIAMAPEARVIINLSEQRVYLVERGKIILIAPIASGKPGWSTPTGNFAIISKDIDHRSASFGSIVDGFGRIAILNATCSTHVAAGFFYRPAPMPYYMEFSPMIGMHSGYLPGYPASHGCVRIPGNIAGQFFQRVHVGTMVRVAGSTKNLSRVRKAIPVYF